MIVWYAQEQEVSCVAACIRIVLSGFEQQLTESRIRRALGNPLFGINLAQAAQRLKDANLLVSHHGDWGLVDLRDCLREGYYPIVGVERRLLGYSDASHAIVLIGISSRFIEAFDPLGAPTPETFKHKTFELAWSSAGRQALVIKSPFPS